MAADWWATTLGQLMRGERISEPPCRHCRYFRPTLDLQREPTFQLCVSPHATYQDFSCYEPSRCRGCDVGDPLRGAYHFAADGDGGLCLNFDLPKEND